jgi:protein-tyrosine phosphatase
MNHSLAAEQRTGTASDRLVNLRDVGGLPLVGGGATRSGVLYRGDASYVGDRAPTSVSTWPPAVVVDLRTERETSRAAYAWPDGTIVHRSPLHEAAVPENIRADGDLASLYRFILDEVPDRVAAAGELVMRAATGPVLVHCAAGKDRTGVVVAALLLASGVEPEAVIADYVATARNMASLEQRWLDTGVRTADSRPLPHGWLLAPAAVMAAVVDRFTAHPGGAGRWLVDHGASSEALDTFRSRLAAATVEVDARPPGRADPSGSRTSPA